MWKAIEVHIVYRSLWGASRLSLERITSVHKGTPPYTPAVYMHIYSKVCFVCYFL